MDMQKTKYESEAIFIATFTDVRLATMFILQFNEVYTNKLAIEVVESYVKDDGPQFFVYDIDK